MGEVLQFLAVFLIGACGGAAGAVWWIVVMTFASKKKH